MTNKFFNIRCINWGSLLTRQTSSYGVSVWKEYVASLISLYKNNGAVSCVGIDFQLRHWLSTGHRYTQILSWILLSHGQIYIATATHSLLWLIPAKWVSLHFIEMTSPEFPCKVTVIQKNVAGFFVWILTWISSLVLPGKQKVISVD